MRDPVQDRDGNSYEKEAITAWVSQHGTSPLTRQPMALTDLVPNRALRDVIESQLGAPIGDDWSVVDAREQGQQETITSAEREGLRDEEESDQAVTLDILANAGKDKVLISITPPRGSHRTPVDLCCVIDVSGSMSSAAQIKVFDEQGGTRTEDQGLTVLDIVKGALKMIVATLGDRDRLALVTFSDSATSLLPLTVMNHGGKTSATQAIERMSASGCTNLWDGLKTGLRVSLEGGRETGRIRSIFLLTDGLPNINPPRGTEVMLQELLASQHSPTTVNMFGFGYQLDSKLLDRLAVIGGGTYAFIPDAGMLGTVFIHALANLLSTFASNVRLRLAPSEGTIFAPPLGVGLEDMGLEIPLGTIQYGQEKDIIVRVAGLANGAYVRATLDYDVATQLTTVTVSSEGNRIATEDDDELRIALHASRMQAVRALRASFEAPRSAVTHINLAMDSVYEARLVDLEGDVAAQAQGLLEDLNGEGRLAFKDENFEKWGKHYIPSLARAHELQQCNNFKDPGVQFYGSPLFREIRSAADKIFDDLPPVTPSRPVYSHVTNSYSRSSAPVSLSTYNNRNDPCFTGDCRVLLQNVTCPAQMRNIVKGDVLKNGAKVLCVVRTLRVRPAVVVALDEGVTVTPWHPVAEPTGPSEEGRWQFPADFGKQAHADVKYLYSLILDKHHIMEMPSSSGGTYQFVTLGHNFTDQVRAHPFFGTEACIAVLKVHFREGYEAGLVDIGGTLRDDTTGLVNGFMPVN